MNVSKAVVVANFNPSSMDKPGADTPMSPCPPIDKTVLEYVLNDLTKSGLMEILVIFLGESDAILNHFDTMTNALPKEASIYFTRSADATDLNSALLKAKNFADDEAFALVFGNYLCNTAYAPVMEKLIAGYREQRHSIIGIIPKKRSKADKDDEKTLIARWDNNKAQSENRHIGRYVLRPEIFYYIEKAQRSYEGSPYDHFTKMIDTMAFDQLVYAQVIG